MARPIPPGTSRWPARANRVRTARMAWTPLLEYSSPVYITGQAPLARARRRARSRTAADGTPAIASAPSGKAADQSVGRGPAPPRWDRDPPSPRPRAGLGPAGVNGDGVRAPPGRRL